VKLRLVLSLFALVAVALSSTSWAAIQGTAVGVFRDPLPGSPPSVTTGIGSSHMTFGVPCDGVTNCNTYLGGAPTPSNSISFEGRSLDCELDQPCVLGIVTFFNGTIMPGTQIASVQLSVSVPSYPGIAPFSAFLTVINTPNTGDPVASRDMLQSGDSRLAVDESRFYSAPLVGVFSGQPQMSGQALGFGTGGAGFGVVVDPVPVPEPSIWLLWLSGVGLVCRVARFPANADRGPGCS